MLFWGTGMAISGFVASHTGLPSVSFTPTVGKLSVVWGSAGGRRWVAWCGVGRGGSVVFSDPQAPIGAVTVYEFEGSRVSLTRRSVGSHLLTDLTGRKRVRFRWLGDDGIEHYPGLSSLSTSNGAVDRWPLVSEPEQVSVEIATVDADTWLMREFATCRDQLLLVHDPVICEVEGCDIPGVRRCVLLSAQESRTEHRDHARRRWQLKVADRSADAGRVAPFSGGPVVTWGEWDAFDHHWEHRTVEELAGLVGGAQ